MKKKRSNIKYMIKEWIAIGKTSFIQAIVRIPVELLLPTLMALVPKLIIDAITLKVADSAMLILVGALTVFLVMLSVIQPYFYGKLNKARFQYSLHFSMKGLRKMLNINYEKIESFEGRRLYERARAFCGLENSATISAGAFVSLSSEIAVSISGIFTYMVLFTVLQPYLVIILLFSSIVEFLILKKMNKASIASRDETSSVYAKLNYYYRIATEPKSGKDVRLYGLSDLFYKALAKLMASMTIIYNKLFRTKIKLTFGQALAVMVRDAASYGFLIAYAVADKMSLSNFIMFFGLLVGFSGWITGLARRINSMKNLEKECDRFRDFMEEKDDNNDTVLPFEGQAESVEFRDVCFSYGKDGQMALKNINFTINRNDRIAIVGENGAGKTTLIKLMCGLYKPTSGEILINGEKITDCVGKNYFNLFATVFQDFYFLPLTILENISMQTIEKSDKNLAMDCLIKAGLKDKIDGQPNGIMSKMVRQVWEDAIEFSGGEQQRLLLARALYKDASILILDEPTSALDPLAEQNIYNSYKEFSKDKISIFISHRLASTQFCTKVFYMSGGEIAERGSHEELLGMRGKYWSMFEAQAYYYNHATSDNQGGQNE